MKFLLGGFFVVKKWITFRTVCRIFLFVIKILIEILVLVIVGLSMLLRLILSWIHWFCYWIAKKLFVISHRISPEKV